MVPVVLAGVFSFASGLSGKLHTPHRCVNLIAQSLAQDEGGYVAPSGLAVEKPFCHKGPCINLLIRVFGLTQLHREPIWRVSCVGLRKPGFLSPVGPRG